MTYNFERREYGFKLPRYSSVVCEPSGSKSVMKTSTQWYDTIRPEQLKFVTWTLERGGTDGKIDP